MKSCIIDMPSNTYALKAQKVLNQKGYACEIKRIENATPEGCGFSITASGDCQKIRTILDSNSIPYVQYRDGGNGKW